jgi:high-affinity Fe2+/Pb2+ permease
MKQRRDDVEHMYRTIIVAVMTAVVLGAVVYLHVVEKGGTLRATLEGTLAVLIAALLDSTRVAVRQKKQRKKRLFEREIEPDEPIDEAAQTKPF